MKRVVALAVLAVLLLMLCACGKVRQAEKAIDAIGDVTADSGTEIEAAEEAVNALSEKQREQVPNLGVLEQAESEYEAALEVKQEEAAAVAAAEAAIDQIGEVTLDSGEAIRAARAAWDAVGPDQQAQVRNREVLTAAEQTYQALAIQAVTDAINAIGPVTLESGPAIEAARTLYDGFSGAVQSQVANRDVLVQDEQLFSALRVQHVTELIDGIGEVTLSSCDKIDEAEAAYAALTEAEAANVVNAPMLAEARDAYDAMETEARRQVAVKEAQGLLRVTRLDMTPLEAEGVELHFAFVNASEQTIRYVYYGVSFYDADGVIVSKEASGADICERVASGPFARGQGTEETESLWGQGSGREAASVRLVELSIEFEDETVYTFTGEQIAAVME